MPDSDGDRLLGVARRLLKHLYDKGAVEGFDPVQSSLIPEAVEADEKDVQKVFVILEKEGLIQGRSYAAEPDLYLTAAGFRLAAEISVGPEGVFFR